MESKKELVEKAKELGLVGYSRSDKKTLKEMIERAEDDRSLAALRRVVESAIRDEFPDGTVIRWVSSGRYIYAAVKASNGQWFTTASSFNSYVAQIMSFDDLMKVVVRAETSEVSIATAWSVLS